MRGVVASFAAIACAHLGLVACTITAHPTCAKQPKLAQVDAGELVGSWRLGRTLLTFWSNGHAVREDVGGIIDVNLIEGEFTWQLADTKGASTVRLANTASGSSETYEVTTACGLSRRVRLTLRATMGGKVEEFVRERHQIGS
jgi:hypothetical protein